MHELIQLPLPRRELNPIAGAPIKAEFPRYIAVGGLAFLIDLGVLFLLTSFAGVNYLVSAAISFTLGLAFISALNRSFLPTRKLSAFAIFALLGLLLNELLMWALTERSGLFYLLSKCCAAPVVLAWTFGAPRWLLFSGGAAGEIAAPVAQSRRHWSLSAPRMVLPLAFIVYLTITVALQWAGSAYRYPMAQYPDESAWYVTGMMVHDFLLHPTSHAMAFAEQFYLHYPRVSLIHWPPMMCVVEALWMIVFGTSPAAVLLLIASLTAALATLLHRVAAKRFGAAYGPMAGLLMIGLRITQAQAGMIMSEMLLALLAFSACLLFTEFLENNRLRASLLFGLAASATILTKGDGWALALVPPAALLLCRRTDLIRSGKLWASALVVIVLCVPSSALTFRVAKLGWSGHLSWSFTRGALPQSGSVLLFALGAAGTLLALIGVAHLAIGSIKVSRPQPIWIVLGSFIAAFFLFENVVPAGIEPRKLFAIIPPAVLFLIGGARWLAMRIALPRISAPVASAAILLVASATSGFAIFFPPPRQPSGMHEVARILAAQPELKHAAVLVSAGGREGVLVGELANLDGRPDHYILRATKQLMTECDEPHQRCPPRYSTPDPVLKFLEDIPVSVVIMEPDRPIRAEEASLLNALESAGSVWQSRQAAGAPGERPIYLYTRRQPVTRSVQGIQVDLRSKLGRLISEEN